MPQVYPEALIRELAERPIQIASISFTTPAAGPPFVNQILPAVQGFGYFIEALSLVVTTTISTPFQIEITQDGIRKKIFYTIWAASAIVVSMSDILIRTMTDSNTNIDCTATSTTRAHYVSLRYRELPIRDNLGGAQQGVLLK